MGSADAPRPPQADAAVQREEIRSRVMAEIAKLPRRRREAFLLRVVEGRTFRQVGEAMGTSPRTAEHQVRAATAILRDSLRPLAREYLERAAGDQ